MIFDLKTLHCNSRTFQNYQNPMPESDFSGRKPCRCQFLDQNIDFLKFYKDLSPFSKMGACHTIQDGGINVGRVYCRTLNILGSLQLFSFILGGKVILGAQAVILGASISQHVKCCWQCVYLSPQFHIFLPLYTSRVGGGSELI